MRARLETRKELIAAPPILRHVSWSCRSCWLRHKLLFKSKTKRSTIRWLDLCLWKNQTKCSWFKHHHLAVENERWPGLMETLHSIQTKNAKRIKLKGSKSEYTGALLPTTLDLMQMHWQPIMRFWCTFWTGGKNRFELYKTEQHEWTQT